MRMKRIVRIRVYGAVMRDGRRTGEGNRGRKGGYLTDMSSWEEREELLRRGHCRQWSRW